MHCQRCVLRDLCGEYAKYKTIGLRNDWGFFLVPWRSKFNLEGDGLTTANGDDLAGDVMGIANQKANATGDILGIAEALQW